MTVEADLECAGFSMHCLCVVDDQCETTVMADEVARQLILDALSLCSRHPV